MVDIENETKIKVTKTTKETSIIETVTTLDKRRTKRKKRPRIQRGEIKTRVLKVESLRTTR